MYLDNLITITTSRIGITVSSMVTMVTSFKIKDIITILKIISSSIKDNPLSIIVLMIIPAVLKVSANQKIIIIVRKTLMIQI